jgi:2-(3-amino-3-carboxypropyl)histidine synthase
MPFLKQELEKGGVKVFTSKGNIARYPSQVLGCDVLAARNIEKYVDAFILLSDGRFHALQLATNKPIFILDENFVRIDKEEIEYMRRKRLAAIKKFLASDKIGIIVSTKPGQERLKEALKIKNILERKRKKVFVFVADTINPAELENFQCHAWLNMACPALVLDSSEIVNWQDVKKFLR